MNSAQWRGLVLCAVSAIGSSAATLILTASTEVDLYALVDKLNVTVARLTALFAVATPLATICIVIHKGATRFLLADAQEDPRFKGGVADADLAEQVPGPKVQSSMVDLERVLG